MVLFEMPLQIRWSDLDPNFHLRHSVYYDWGALCRTQYLVMNGVTPALMAKHKFGPVIFREEAVFRKEVHFGDNISINIKLTKSRRDYSRWTIVHEIMRDGNTLCCTLTIEGAWINVTERKLMIPPAEVGAMFNQISDENVSWED